MSVSRGTLVQLTREIMDAVGSDRWSDDLIKRALNVVYDDEWSNVLNAAPYYTFGMRQPVTDTSSQIPFASLESGGGDTQENFYRLLSVSDGNTIYSETRFQDVPLATTSNYLPTYPRLYYIVGQIVQVLPLSTNVQMYIGVNWKPTALLDLASDDSVINFPFGGEWMIATEAASRLLNKGGAESNAAQVLKGEAAELRAGLLDDLRRRTINPTLMAYPDRNLDWAGG